MKNYIDWVYADTIEESETKYTKNKERHDIKEESWMK